MNRTLKNGHCRKRTPYCRIKKATIGGIIIEKHYGHIIIDKVIEMQSRGLTLREIGEELGYEKWQMHDVLVKHRRKERLNLELLLKRKEDLQSIAL